MHDIITRLINMRLSPPLHPCTALDQPSWMNDQKQEHDQEHKWGVKEIDEDFVRYDEPPLTLKILDCTDNTANNHDDRHSLDGSEVSPPPYQGWIQERSSFLSYAYVQIQRREDKDTQGAELNYQTSNKNSSAFSDGIWFSRSRYDGAYELADNACDVNEDV